MEPGLCMCMYLRFSSLKKYLCPLYYFEGQRISALAYYRILYKHATACVTKYVIRCPQVTNGYTRFKVLQRTTKNSIKSISY